MSERTQSGTKVPEAKSDTPRTDAFAHWLYNDSCRAAYEGTPDLSPEAAYGKAIDFARGLERECQVGRMPTTPLNIGMHKALNAYALGDWDGGDAAKAALASAGIAIEPRDAAGVPACADFERIIEGVLLHDLKEALTPSECALVAHRIATTLAGECVPQVVRHTPDAVFEALKEAIDHAANVGVPSDMLERWEAALELRTVAGQKQENSNG